jgi:2-octaprenyl-6-methoxyphenol hydroxylase
MSNKKSKKFDIAIVGGGLAGLTMAVSLKSCNASIALIAPKPKTLDKRTTALLNPSIEFYKSLGIWDTIEPLGAPLKTMRLIDGSKRLLRAPTVEFHDHEMELPAFGHNVPNAALLGALNAELQSAKNITHYDCSLKSINDANNVANEDVTTSQLTLENNDTIQAALTIAADGRNSIIRETLGFSTRTWSYPQHAMVVNFAHKRPHNYASNEFHTETGPFTQVPLPNESKPHPKYNWRSSLVWVVTPQQAEEYKAKSREELAATIEHKMHSIMGALELESDLQSFPLHGMIAESFGKNRTALIGETAHVFPPIGAQGFNLGVRDVKALHHHLTAQDISATLANPQSMLDAYSSERRRDASLRTEMIDLFNRSLLTNFLPIQAGRSAGLFALSRIPALKKGIMKQSLG